MSGSKSTEDTRPQRVRQHFFIPIDESTFFAKLDEAIDQSKLPFTDNAKSFKRNLESVMLTVAVPFHLTVAGVHRLRFQQLHIAEKIRSLKSTEENESETEESENRALAIARDRFSEEQALPENIKLLSNKTLDILEESLGQDEFARASSELLRQGVVSAWGSFEVLVQDLVATLLNARPNAAVILLTHERTKALFQLKSLPLDTLAAHNFNVSESLGSILIRQRSVDTVPIMKAVFSVVLPKSEKLREILDRKELWILNQRRHLLVHRRGIVDADYIKKTGESVSLGDDLVIRPDNLELYLTIVNEAGTELINEIVKYY